MMALLQRALPLRLRTRLEERAVRALTYIAARAPWAWQMVRWLMPGIFDPLATTWQRRVTRPGSGWADAFTAGLAELRSAPRRALDLGTGTGLGASLVAVRFPSAEVIGVDIAPRMVAQARELHRDLGNLRFEVGDSARLPFEDASFDLVTSLNVPVFFRELARVTVSGGSALICFSRGPRTPIYLPTDEVERRLRDAGFVDVHSSTAGEGVWTLGVRSRRSDEGARTG